MYFFLCVGFFLLRIQLHHRNFDGILFIYLCVSVVEESVAGGSEDSDDDVGHEDSGDEEWQQALTVGGLGNSMSKGELASLIQQGARAILQTQVLTKH